MVVDVAVAVGPRRGGDDNNHLLPIPPPRESELWLMID